MKKLIIALNLCLALLVGHVLSVAFSSDESNKAKNEPNQIVLIGMPSKDTAPFKEALKGGDMFYNLYDKAREYNKVGDYEMAIKIYNEAIPYAALGPEVSMIYRKLSEIYREQENLQKELLYVEMLPKYSMNKEANEESKKRAIELRQLLAAKAQSSQT